MSKVSTITDKDFEHLIDDSMAVPVVVYYWAEWCGPCKKQGPIMDELAEQYDGLAHFAKINADENPISAQKGNVAGLPAIHIYDGRNIMLAYVGGQSKSKLSKVLNALTD